MKRLRWSLAPWFAIVLLVAVLAALPASADGKHWVCPPCGAPCDAKVFDAPGVCPECGMTLVEAGSKAAQPVADPSVKRVAILVFNGVEILDYTGPYEMFGAANCDVYTVAATKDPVTTAMGMTVVPRYTFADAPAPDVLVVPGGSVKGASNSTPTLDYVRATTAHDAYTMSVCNGAFILASAGLLDGLTATTTNHNIPRLAEQFPKVKVVSDKRYVDNGRIITTAGLSAGIDGALHVIDRLFGTGLAQEVALAEEYDWHPDAAFARAALADQQIPDLNLDSLGTWKLMRTEGDVNRWNVVAVGTPSVPRADLATRLGHALERGHWTRVSGGTEAAATRWRFTGRDGKPWDGTLKLDTAPAGGQQVEAALTIARAGE